MNGQAEKDKVGKTQFELLPVYPLEIAARILTQATKENGGKYEAENWRKGRNWMSTIGALERHVAAFKSGENIDPETKESHLGSIICNAMFLLEHTVTCPLLDDRPRAVGRNGKIV